MMMDETRKIKRNIYTLIIYYKVKAERRASLHYFLLQTKIHLPGIRATGPGPNNLLL